MVKFEEIKTLCKSCKNCDCKKSFLVIQEEKIKTIKCLEYKMDKSKIESYKKVEFSDIDKLIKII